MAVEDDEQLGTRSARLLHRAVLAYGRERHQLVASLPRYVAGPRMMPRSLGELCVALECAAASSDAVGGLAGADAAMRATSSLSGNARTAAEAADLWRRAGVVVFPALLDADVVSALLATVNAQRRAPGGGGTVDKSEQLRAAKHGARELRGVPLAGSRAALSQLATRLAPFFAAALRDASALLLESSCMVSNPGAAAQDWHMDTPLHDARFAAVQVALTDVEPSCAPLEVLPGSHLLTLDFEAIDSEGIDPVARAFERLPSVPPIRVAPLPPGSVTVYAPRLVHRGCANETDRARTSLAFTLLPALAGLLMPSLPYTIQPEDAWQWRLENGRLERGAWR